ncbi:sulfurtransferase TusA [Acinetobacter sp. MD2]|uniref:sulfurtransferase TusA n=1 Tax=Acinetobacter sp. MD2 TaxID=2600066 RepID=UPI002D1F2D7F|nr:sulfurtransferase TusA [Acinetobacter sp. MD2]MEB3767016.1 sulfurtransferase TusA [Acinetobacter sp. MD2]
MSAPILPATQLNTRGLYCPDPIMMLRQALRKVQTGDVVEVFATDISTSWDIPRFCVHMGHELLLQEEVLDEKNQKEYHYLVKKG